MNELAKKAEEKVQGFVASKDVPTVKPEELVELEESPAEMTALKRQPKESPFQYCFRIILRDPESRDGIFLTRILLSLTDGTKWPYPLEPAIQQLSPLARKVATEMVIIFLSNEGKVREDYFARALADDELFRDYAEECRPVRAWFMKLNEEAEHAAQMHAEVTNNTEDD